MDVERGKDPKNSQKSTSYNQGDQKKERIRSKERVLGLKKQKESSYFKRDTPSFRQHIDSCRKKL